VIEIRTAILADVPCLYAIYEAMGRKDEGYFERSLEEGRTILMADFEGRTAGFGILNWRPKYALYRKLGFPEIQDLNVLPDMRQKGVATALILKCEALAREKKCESIGVSVGLTKKYGPAQRLYTKMGYRPDGNGVTYDRASVSHGQRLPADDDFCLMLVKNLEGEG